MRKEEKDESNDDGDLVHLKRCGSAVGWGLSL